MDEPIPVTKMDVQTGKKKTKVSTSPSWKEKSAERKAMLKTC